ncbi:MAG: hypothetical protein E7405_02190 [Ruminococcaceae bacterium]|nr:hypothetical protein [Oscillospiraceae bacterium]
MNNRIYKTTKELTPFIKEMLENNKSVQLTVTGNSMFPLFKHLRDTVTVKKTDDYKKYDIILYLRKNGELVLHRVVKVKDEVFYLCGDNQILIEYPIYKDQIMGKVTSFVRKGKSIKADSFISKFYAVFWCFLLKVRKPVIKALLKIWGFIKR